jgi:hypothetical protein
LTNTKPYALKVFELLQAHAIQSNFPPDPLPFFMTT